MRRKPYPESRQDLLVEDPPYTEYELADLAWKNAIHGMLREGAVDAYCTACQRTSVFKIETPGYKLAELAAKLAAEPAVIIEARCARDHAELNGLACSGRLIAVFRRDDKVVHKIGLHPSKANLDLGRLDPALFKELDTSHRRELTRAVGLRAHSVGIGSFVYLRRIVESLIEEAHQSARAQDDWNEGVYQSARISERIGALKGYLPSRLVKSAHLYGILSKGLHELTDDECLDHFDLLFGAISMILKERNENKQYERIIRDVAKVGGELRSTMSTEDDSEQLGNPAPNLKDGADS